MKNILAVVFMLAVLPCVVHIQQASASETASFEKINYKVARAAQNQKAKNTNTGASTQNLRVDFTISEKFYDKKIKQDNGPYNAHIACKAYALDSHWLILAGTCMDYSNEDLRDIDDRFYIRRYNRQIKRALIGSTTLDERNHARTRNVMLIWNDKSIFQGPYVNVLATAAPKQLFTLSANHLLKIHTSCLNANALRARTLKPNSVKGNTFKLDEGFTDLSGTATDPLFLFSARGNEFLSAYNAGKISYALQISYRDVKYNSHGNFSDTWYTLSANDLQFIKKTVQQHRPKDWARIKGRLFFNQTSVPFFK